MNDKLTRLEQHAREHGQLGDDWQMHKMRETVDIHRDGPDRPRTRTTHELFMISSQGESAVVELTKSAHNRWLRSKGWPAEP